MQVFGVPKKQISPAKGSGAYAAAEGFKLVVCRLGMAGQVFFACEGPVAHLAVVDAGVTACCFGAIVGSVHDVHYL